MTIPMISSSDCLRALAEEWFGCCDDIHEPLLEVAANIDILLADRQTLTDALMRAEKMIDASHKLLREWLETEMDTEDDDYQEWIDDFTARVRAVLDHSDEEAP